MAIVGVISHSPVEMIDHGSVTWFGGDHQARDVQLTGAKSLKCPTPSTKDGGALSASVGRFGLPQEDGCGCWSEAMFGSLTRDLEKILKDVARDGSAFPCGTWKGCVCWLPVCFHPFAIAFRMCLLLYFVKHGERCGCRLGKELTEMASS